ncbi:uncharacterized protein LOC130848471 [Hippopotamus amphibius kiboko]|uniref:uncharacterized protein LOC130848471 n=1 Tax=Hippopotamus amphibius kiboko TaxID=575201 RepID=UPI002595E2FB|nr:uncharacterized protein LOC130848471 [Hippopotamus amphibius kiboko]
MQQSKSNCYLRANASAALAAPLERKCSEAVVWARLAGSGDRGREAGCRGRRALSGRDFLGGGGGGGGVQGFPAASFFEALRRSLDAGVDVDAEGRGGRARSRSSWPEPPEVAALVNQRGKRHPSGGSFSPGNGLRIGHRGDARVRRTSATREGGRDLQVGLPRVGVGPRAPSPAPAWEWGPQRFSPPAGKRGPDLPLGMVEKSGREAWSQLDHEPVKLLQGLERMVTSQFSGTRMPTHVEDGNFRLSTST